VIVAGAFPGETKMWAAVRRNGISWASCLIGQRDLFLAEPNSGHFSMFSFSPLNAVIKSMNENIVLNTRDNMRKLLKIAADTLTCL